MPETATDNTCVPPPPTGWTLHEYIYWDLLNGGVLVWHGPETKTTYPPEYHIAFQIHETTGKFLWRVTFYPTGVSGMCRDQCHPRDMPPGLMDSTRALLRAVGVPFEADAEARHAARVKRASNPKPRKRKAQASA